MSELFSKIYDHKTQRFIHGHQIVTAAILFRGVVLPWRFQVWVPKAAAGQSYQKTTHIAAQMINEFELPWDLQVRVLFDAFYLSPCIVKACESRGFTWFSVASKNRKVSRQHCQTRSISEFAAGVLKHHGRRVRLRRARSWRWMRIAHVDDQLNRLGQVRLVLSKRPGNPWKKTLAVVTNETKLAAREILVICEQRWNIEVLFKELRSSLGALRLSGFEQTRHRASPAPVRPGPPTADPPQPRRCRCTSQTNETDQPDTPPRTPRLPSLHHPNPTGQNHADPHQKQTGKITSQRLPQTHTINHHLKTAQFE